MLSQHPPNSPVATVCSFCLHQRGIALSNPATASLIGKDIVHNYEEMVLNLGVQEDSDVFLWYVMSREPVQH